MTKFKFIAKILVGALATLGLVYWLAHQIQFKVFLDYFSKANPVLLILAGASSVAIICLNSIQFKLFLPKFRSVSFKSMFKLIAVFSMMVNVVPFWGGHALLVYLLGHGQKVGKTVALSAITLDQIIEGFAKFFIFTFVAFTATFPTWMKSGIESFMVIFGILYLSFFFLAFKYRNHTEKIHEAKSGLLNKLLGVFKNWAYNLHTLRKLSTLLTTIALATFMKFLEVVSVFLIQKALGVGLGWDAAFLVVAAISIATTLPLTPGRIGIFESAALLTYQHLGLDPSLGLALGVAIHVAHTLPFIVVGYVSAFLMGFKGVVPKVKILQPGYEAS